KEKQPVTLRELMGHLRGVTPDDGHEAPLFTQHCASPVEAVQYFKNWLYFEPGSEGRYSIYDWILVSAAIEAAAKQPFLTFMREQIFDPLGMRDTIPDAATIEAGEDFPLANMIRELIYDPEATRGSIPDFTKKDRVTPY